MSNEQYNGWANRETWLVNLWLTNDAGTYAAAREICGEGQERPAVLALQEFVESIAFHAVTEQESSGLGVDLIGQSLAWVDWREIVQSFRED